MAMTGFICHDDYLNKTAKLTDEEVGRLFRACMRYHATGEAQELTGRESIAFDFIREDIDRAEQAYKAKCEINKQNRAKAIERTLTNVDERQQPSTDVKPKREVKRFTPPTLDEVRAYCEERKNGINPQQFIDYYTARGWELKPGQKVKDWRACVRTWEGHEKKSSASGSPKKIAAQDYTQRDYSTDQDKSFEEMMKMLGA